MPYNNILENKRKDVTYGWIVMDYCPPKDDLYWNHLTVGFNLIKHSWKFITRTSYLTREKLLFNSRISAPEAHFM